MNNKEFLETAAWVTSKVLFTLVKLLRKSLQKADRFCTTKLFRKEELIDLKGAVQETTEAVPVKQWSCNNTDGDMKLELFICPLSHHERALVPTQLQKLHLCTYSSSAGEQTHVTLGCALQSLNGRDIVESSQENFTKVSS